MKPVFTISSDQSVHQRLCIMKSADEQYAFYDRFPLSTDCSETAARINILFNSVAFELNAKPNDLPILSDYQITCNVCEH